MTTARTRSIVREKPGFRQAMPQKAVGCPRPFVSRMSSRRAAGAACELLQADRHGRATVETAGLFARVVVLRTLLAVADRRQPIGRRCHAR